VAVGPLLSRRGNLVLNWRCGRAGVRRFSLWFEIFQKTLLPTVGMDINFFDTLFPEEQLYPE